MTMLRSLLILLLALACQPAWAQLELKFGHVGDPGSLFELSANEFAKRANAKLAGKATVVVFGSSQLGGDKEMLQKLKLGTLDFALPSTVMSSEADLFGLFEMPYLVRDRAHMAKIERDIFWPKLAPAAEAKGLKILAVWENGYRHITNSKRPIVKPGDLQGIKLRVRTGTLHGDDHELNRRPRSGDHCHRWVAQRSRHADADLMRLCRIHAGTHVHRGRLGIHRYGGDMAQERSGGRLG